MQLTQLKLINSARPLRELSKEQLEELQTALSRLGLYRQGDIDGLIGPKTRTAWSEFKTDVFQGNPGLIGPGSISLLQEKVQELESGRNHIFDGGQGTMNAIKWECKTQGIGLNTQQAYVLATVEWETAQTFEPVREAFWRSEDWRRQNLRYYPYYGRGFVQLTHKANYQKYSRILGLDLVNNPDLAMDNNFALFILVHGFKTGTFTGRKITDYITQHRTDFVGARRCINGTDKAHEIARVAERYLTQI